MARKGSKGGGGNLFLGFLLGAVTVVGGGYAWKHYGGSRSSLSSALPSLPSLPAGPASDGGRSGDPAMANTPAAPRPHARPKPPFGTSEEVFEDGARTYRVRCAGCHGTPNIAAPQVKGRAAAPQLWRKGSEVSGWDPGDIYTRVAQGRHGSMPPFAGHLSDIQIWQVALLLDNSGDELPDPVIRILEKK